VLSAFGARTSRVSVFRGTSVVLVVVFVQPRFNAVASRRGMGWGGGWSAMNGSEGFGFTVHVPYRERLRQRPEESCDPDRRDCPARTGRCASADSHQLGPGGPGGGSWRGPTAATKEDVITGRAVLGPSSLVLRRWTGAERDRQKPTTGRSHAGDSSRRATTFGSSRTGPGTLSRSKTRPSASPLLDRGVRWSAHALYPTGRRRAPVEDAMDGVDLSCHFRPRHGRHPGGSGASTGPSASGHGAEQGALSPASSRSGRCSFSRQGEDPSFATELPVRTWTPRGPRDDEERLQTTAGRGLLRSRRPGSSLTRDPVTAGSRRFGSEGRT
jgi:hypothetical protein